MSTGRLEHVPHPAHGVDHRLPTSVDLLAQVGDVELDDVRLAAEVVVPHPVKDLRLAEYPARVAHEVAQQFELGRGELHDLACPAYLPGVFVHDEVTDRELGDALRPRQTGSAQQAAQPGQDLLPVSYTHLTLPTIYSV